MHVAGSEPEIGLDLGDAQRNALLGDVGHEHAAEQAWRHVDGERAQVLARGGAQSVADPAHPGGSRHHDASNPASATISSLSARERVCVSTRSGSGSRYPS